MTRGHAIPFFTDGFPITAAVENLCRHDVQKFEIAVDVPEDALQIGEHGAGKLIDQKGAVRPKDGMGGP